jgi:hypothetical protein
MPPVPELTQDRGWVLEAVAEAPLSSAATDLSAGLRQAARLLSASALRERRIFVFTDLAAHGWDLGRPPWPASGGPPVSVIDVSAGPEPGNRAVLGLRVELAAELGPRAVRLSAEIGNFGEQPEQDLGVTLRIDGRAVARGSLDIAAWTRGSKSFTHVFAAPGFYDAQVELGHDALAADDQRFVRIEARRDIKLLLVDGDPRSVRRADEIYYLETALRPGDRGESQLAVATTTAEELGKRRLSDYDVLFLCNLAALDPARVAEIRSFVARGGGLFISLGDRVDADAYEATMEPLLPQRLHTQHSASPQPGPGQEAGASLRAARLGRFDRRHPVLAVFPQRQNGLDQARFYRFFLLHPTADSPTRQVLLRYDDGAPAMVESQLGEGRVLLFTSTIDRDWTDLPIHPGFLPLVQQVVRYLARTPLREPAPPALVGKPQAIALAEGDTRVEVTMPSGRKLVFGSERLAGRRQLQFSGVDEPGIYRVAVASESGALRDRPGAGFAANLEPRESDLRKLSPAGLAAVTGAAPTARHGAAQRRVELWHGIAAVLLGLLLLEALLTQQRNRPAGSARRPQSA